ncbi:MAG: efflux RND transporter permease subunit, partial [Spirochaetes bacterium]|nr:efflux RND transporter permease subunit [Spirochaetota bacterium]
MISKIAVNKPTTVLIIFLLLIGLGFYASMDLAIDLFPEINPPVLIILTDYAGTAPEEIEKSVTRPLESTLSNVGNIDKITSTSSEGSSQIMVEFTWGTDMNEAANDVRDKLEFVKPYLPEDASTPMIFKFDPSMMPIMYLSLKGKRSAEELREIGEKIVQPRLEQVEGVAMAGLSGGRERMIRVEVPQNRLQAYNLTLTQIQQSLMGNNIQISAGSITEGNKNYLIRTSGEYQDIEQIKNAVIGYKQEGNLMGGDMNQIPIRLQDIANVYDGLKKEEEAAYINGEPALQLTIQKQSGTNSVKTAENVYKRLAELESELPQNVSIDMIYDNTKIIKNALSQVSTAAITGALLAVIILFIFLRSFKTVIIISFSIPISVILTLMLMYFFGFTLNLMTLAGLALGVGMLVDNSIVILENIFRYREKGAKLHAAAILGSSEMINAIVASTLTTICVFAPVAMFKSQLGIYGELFSGLAFTVVFSLTTSLLVAIFLVPVLSSRYLPITSKLEQDLKGPLGALDKAMGKFFHKLDNAYKNSLAIVLRHRIITIIVIVVILVVSLAFLGKVGFELMPSADEDFVQLDIELPIGTKLEVTKNIVSQFEEIVKSEIDGYENIVAMSGEKSFFGFMGAIQGHKGSLLIPLKPMSERTLTSTEIKTKLRKYFHDFPSVVFSFSSGMQMGGGGTPIDILIKSNDLNRARDVAYQIKDLLKAEIAEVTEPSVDFKEGLPQIEIYVDRDKAYALGLNIMTIGQEIKANIDGVTASQYREEGNEYDILVILDPKDRDEVPDLEKIYVMNQMGQKIPVANFASYQKTTGPINISRENQMRTIHVTAGLEKFLEVKTNGKTKKLPVKLNEVEMKIQKLIRETIPQDDDLIIEFSGEYADMIEYGQKLMLILLISILLVFGVMASQFESFLDPFIILFTIPLMLIGVIMIYLLTVEQFSILTIVGMVVLVGIVVNNGIVLVDYTNLLVRRGLPIIEACIEAGKNRLRPILMTSLTTILGLLPMALTKVEGAELSRPIAKTVVGGLIFSSIFTLYLIPVIYSLFN